MSGQTTEVFRLTTAYLRVCLLQALSDSYASFGIYTFSELMNSSTILSVKAVCCLVVSISVTHGHIAIVHSHAAYLYIELDVYT